VVIARDFVEYGLNFLVGVPALRLFFHHQIGAHASAGEVLYAAAVLGTIGMGIKMPGPRIADVLQPGFIFSVNTVSLSSGRLVFTGQSNAAGGFA
jgi:hypothetical protein